MKIGIFTDCYYPQVNGVVTSIMMLEKELIKLGHEVTIVTVKVPNFKDKKDNIIRVPSFPFAKCKEFRIGLPFFLANSYKEIKDKNFDIIHTHTEFSIGLLGRYMAKVHDIPCLHTYHTMYEDYTHYISKGKYGQFIFKKAIKSSSKLYFRKYDGLIAPTLKTKKALESYGVKNNIFIVPTGIDLNSFKKHSKNDTIMVHLKKELNINANDNVILSLGRISEEKSIDLIIKQMPTLLKSLPTTKLVIVGDGPYRKTLETLVESLNLTTQVIFIGKIPFEKVSYYYSLANVFVSASKTETQGLTIIEAMAADVPVVVYNDTNVSDIVIDDVSGRLFDTEIELGEKLIDCLKNSSKTKTLQKKASNIVQNLSKEKFALNLEKVYFDLCNNHKSNIIKSEKGKALENSKVVK